MSDELTEQVRDEVAAVHAFIQAWIRGEIDDTDADWEPFAERFADRFAMIHPGGDFIGSGAAVPGVRRMHGTNERFRIVTREVRLVEVSDALVVATYHELQRFARHTTEPENGRASTVVFERAAGRLLWTWLHETWLSAEILDGVTFDF